MYYRRSYFKYIVLALVAAVVWWHWGKIDNYLHSFLTRPPKEVHTYHIQYKTPSQVLEPTTEHHPDKEVPTRDYYETTAKIGDVTTHRVFFHPALEDENPYTIYTYPLQYDVEINRYQTDEGDFNEKATLVVKNVVLDESQVAEVQSLDFKIFYNKREWRWNPKLGMGMLVTNKLLSPEINIALWSYGRSKKDYDWCFGVIGVGGTDDYFAASVKPFEYRISNFIPFTDNFYLGPVVAFDTDGDISAGVGFTLKF